MLGAAFLRLGASRREAFSRQFTVEGRLVAYEKRVELITARIELARESRREVWP